MKINSNYALKFGNSAYSGVKKQTKSDNSKAIAIKQQSLPNAYYLHPSMNFCAALSAKVNNLFSQLKTNDTEASILYDIESLNDDEQKEFIEQYCKKTGFPNLKNVNANMKTHATDVMKKASEQSGANLLWSGFHRHCSASVGLALPGSDLDAMCAIVDGSQDEIDYFKNRLWNSFDPSIVSIRKDFEFPDVFSLDQLYEWTKLVDEIVKDSGMDKKTEKYKENLKEQHDYEKALEFNIDIAHQIEHYSKEELASLAPSVSMLINYGETPKNITQSMSSTLETLRSGNCLIQEDKLSSLQKRKFDSIKDSYLYKYGNLCIQDADYGIKEKLIKRKNFINEQNFSTLSQDEQMDLILRMLYESYPSWSKSKLDVNYGESFNYMFDNGDNVNESRDRAFRQTVDS